MIIVGIHYLNSADARCTTAEEAEAVKTAWRQRLDGLFVDDPIPFRRQNGGDFLDWHAMPNDVVPGRTGFANLVGA